MKKIISLVCLLAAAALASCAAENPGSASSLPGQADSSTVQAVSVVEATSDEATQSLAEAQGARQTEWSRRCVNTEPVDLESLLAWTKDFGGVPGFFVYVSYDAATGEYRLDEGSNGSTIDAIVIANDSISFYLKPGIGFAKYDRGSGGTLNVNDRLQEGVASDGTAYSIHHYQYNLSQNDADYFVADNGQAVLKHYLGRDFAEGEIRDFYYEWGKVD